MDTMDKNDAEKTRGELLAELNTLRQRNQELEHRRANPEESHKSRKAVTALKENQAYLHLAINAAPMILWALDAEGVKLPFPKEKGSKG